ncbi:MAG: radical SAM protein [Actinomycetales bacterium]
MKRYLNTDSDSERLRGLLIDAETRSVALTRFSDSAQLEDIRSPLNGDGFGRLHTFVEESFEDWPANPLPNRPACAALGMPDSSVIVAQVFQNAGCNWRCWYCYVPFGDLSGRRGHMITVDRMVEWSLRAHPRPHLVDLSGGQPDLTPEWSVWFRHALDRAGCDDIYLWSDDNLSTDYLWRYLSEDQRRYLGDHPLYGRAVCLKGFDARSFAFNTLAEPALFDRQFELLGRLHQETTIDYYVYLTITCDTSDGLDSKMASLFDRLQDVGEYLPLRCIPLKIVEWGPVTPRLTDTSRQALRNQFAALDAWTTELERRFPGTRPTIENVPR